MSKLCKSCGNYYEGDHCDKCGYVPVPESELPLVQSLNVSGRRRKKSFTPSGKRRKKRTLR